MNERHKSPREMIVFDARIVAAAVMAAAMLQFALFVAGWITGEHAVEPMRAYAGDARMRLAAMRRQSPLRAAPVPAAAPPAAATLRVPPPLQLVFAPLPPLEPRPLVRRPIVRRRRAEAAPDAYAHLIRETALRHDVPAALVEAIVRVESDFDARAVSPKGARGLMQVMPATGRRFGVSDPEHLLRPGPNLSAGTAYLSWLLARFEGDLDLTLAAYNAGEGAVANYGGIPPYRETREYVRRVRQVLSRNTA